MQLSVPQVARLLGIPESQVYRWINDGEIPYYRVNEQLRFNQTELLEWATVRKIPVSDRIFHDTDTRIPHLADALRAGGIHHNIEARGRDAILRAVVSRMPIPDDEDRELLIQIWLGRGAAGLTSVGEGIAIPHVRSPVVLNGAAPSITLCTLQTPANIGSHDGQPIHTIFAIMSPGIRSHLRLLARLAAALHDPEFKAAVLRRAPEDEIFRHAGRLDAESARLSEAPAVRP